ncbi:hypothetical protein Mapa_002721 [Marchantia paleacea]|nr:hypothetical protein Mapa_002721 [Marchantia paleacea]
MLSVAFQPSGRPPTGVTGRVEGVKVSLCLFFYSWRACTNRCKTTDRKKVKIQMRKEGMLSTDLL